MIEQIGSKVVRTFRVEGEKPVIVTQKGMRKHIIVFACEVTVSDGFREQILLTGNDVTRQLFPVTGVSVQYDNIGALPIEKAPPWACQALEALRAAV